MADPKNYKAEEDPERAFYLISFCNVAKDYLATQALASSFMRELTAMNLRQVERDTKAAKENAAKPAAKPAEEDDDGNPMRAPSIPRR